MLTAQLVISVSFNNSKLECLAKNCNCYVRKQNQVFDVHVSVERIEDFCNPNPVQFFQCVIQSDPHPVALSKYLIQSDLKRFFQIPVQHGTRSEL